MPDDDKRIIDWTNLPDGIEQHSLWDCLHDGQLLSIRSDLLQRSVLLTFDVLHIREFHALPEDMRFVFQLDGVQSSRVIRYAKWPGDVPVLAGLPRDEQSRLVKEYQAKWREESASWSSVEGCVTGDASIDISVVWLAMGQGEHLALRLTGHDTNDEYLEFFLRAEKLDVVRSDGERIGLAQFKKLGEAYWEAFAARGRKRRGPVE